MKFKHGELVHYMFWVCYSVKAGFWPTCRINVVELVWNTLVHFRGTFKKDVSCHAGCLICSFSN